MSRRPDLIKTIPVQARSRTCLFPTWNTLLGLLLLGSLTGCARNLNMQRIEAAIQDDIERGGVPVRSVACPTQVAIAPGESFYCEGELANDGTFTVAVTQQDELGNVSWEIPNSKGLLNLNRLEGDFQQAINSETGTQSFVDCGGAFRANQPGDAFECRVINGNLPAQGRIERILVKIDALGNITWQQVRQQQVAANPANPTNPLAAQTTPDGSLPAGVEPSPPVLEGGEAAVPGSEAESPAAEDSRPKAGYELDFD